MGDWIPDHRCDCSVRDDGVIGSRPSPGRRLVLVSPVAHAASLVKSGGNPLDPQFGKHDFEVPTPSVLLFSHGAGSRGELATSYAVSP
jgi:hypothetical protein